MVSHPCTGGRTGLAKKSCGDLDISDTNKRMKPSPRIHLLSALAIGIASGVPAIAQDQIPLAPGNVIGGTNPYNPQFANSNVLDAQTGDISEPTQNGYWLNPDGGPQDAFIVIDLGQAFRIGELQLFNTHNAQFNDRGTGDFTITGSNEIAATDRFDAFGSDIVGGTLLLTGTLAPASQVDDPIDAQSFNVMDTSTYRYLRFDAETVASGGAPCCGANN